MPTTFTTNNLPTRSDLWHDEATVMVGNALVLTIDNAQVGNLSVRQNPGTIGDKFSQSVFLRAGTYTFSVIGQTNNANGQIDWAIDGVAFATAQDWYTAGLTRNVVKTASVTIASDGYHILTGTVSNRNASSAGYNMDLTKYWLRQATD